MAKILIFAEYKYKTILKNTQKHIFLQVLFCLVSVLWLNAPDAISADGKNLGLKTVCIDAGHGGTDPGCVSKDKKTYESRIALDIAKRLSGKIKADYNDVKVVMTRSTDTFITLGGRADVANKNNADLFISIHVNMASSTAANGYSIHVLGQSSQKNRDLFAYNMDVCKRENSVIMLEDDYSTKYQGFDPTDPESFIFFNLMQNAHLEQSLLFAQDVEKAMSSGPMRTSRGIWQDPFYVLWKTAMPAVLIEVGFMSNATDLAVLRSEDGREKIAEDIFNAFVVFKKRYDGSVNAGASSEKSASDATVSSEESTATGKSSSAGKTSNEKSTLSSKATTTAASASAGKSSTEKSSSASKSSSEKPASGVKYGTQVLASGKLMQSGNSYFKGFAVTRIQSGNIYKYILGVSDTLESAKSQNVKIKKSFPDSFLVSIDGNNVKLVK